MNASKPSIIITCEVPAPIGARLSELFNVHFCDLQREGHEAFFRQLGDPSGIVVRPGDRVDAEFFGYLPKSVKVISSYSVGLDHIDLSAAEARGITVTNTPDVLTDATAEIALLLMLGAVRGAGDASKTLYSGQWKPWSPDQIYGRDLSGKRLGIVGAGRIGVATAKRAAAFGTEIAYWSRRASEPMETLGAERHTALASLVKVCDIISLHVPATPETKNLINAELLAQFKPRSVLINTGRGDLISEDALFDALEHGHLAAAGLDVYVNEPVIDPRFLEAPNLFLLPHIGSATEETRLRMGDLVIAGLIQHLL